MALNQSLVVHPDPQISVVIPAYNEEARLGPTLDKVVSYLRTRREPYEVLVADDGSTDGTLAIVGGFAALGARGLPGTRHEGKGSAVRRGVLSSRGAWVLVCDADLSTPIEELELLEQAADADLVLASRASTDSRVGRRQALPRELMGKAFNLIVRSLGLTDLRDTQCGFKLIRGSVARELFARMTVDGFAFDVELIWVARHLGYRVLEVGVEWHNSPPSKVGLVRDSVDMLWDVLKLRLRDKPRPDTGS